MIRASVCAAVLVWAVPAAADVTSTADAEKVVRANIAGAFSSHKALDATTTGDALVFEPLVDENQSPWFSDKDKNGDYNNDIVMIWGRDPVVMSAKIAPFKPRITVDDKVAWFSAELKVTAFLRTGERMSMDTKGTWPVRVTGILVNDKGWKVAAEKFSLAAADRALGEDSYLANYGALVDDDAKEIAAWFPQHLAEHQSVRATGANGTSTTEVGRDKAGITKLARSWDKLTLTPLHAEVDELAGGKIAWVHVDATLDGKKRRKLLTLGAVAVREDGHWKWVSLNWSPEVYFVDATH